jgi:hypothetical protein
MPTTRVFGDKSGFTASPTPKRKPGAPPPKRRSPFMIVILVAAGLAAAFFALQQTGVLDGLTGN